VNKILKPLSIATVLFSIAGATFAVAQVNPDDFTEEPDKTMAASHSSFVKGDTAKASQQIRKAATYVKKMNRVKLPPALKMVWKRLPTPSISSAAKSRTEP
jgi:hypothetical protein